MSDNIATGILNTIITYTYIVHMYVTYTLIMAFVSVVIETDDEDVKIREISR